MKERPILFGAPMVRAILSGQKTVTRRPVTPQPTLETDDWVLDAGGTGKWMGSGPSPATGGTRQTWSWSQCPYGQPGDRLWVRETWCDVNLQGAPGIAYRADDDVRDLMEDESFLDEDGAFNYDDPRSKPYQFACWSEDLIAGTEGRWRPSIHMPRWTCRILLEITVVRVERLQDITPNQCIAEGAWPEEDKELGRGQEAVAAFAELWKSTGGNWDANPWIWVVEFKRVKP